MARLTTIAAAALLLCGAAHAQDGGSATTRLMDQSGTALGTITLMDRDGGLHLGGDLTGITNGDHGFHIHAAGKCDAAGKFESAGPHFDSGGHKHGTENPEGPHSGDLMNVTADADGKASVDLIDPNATIKALNDANGAALVLHADPDDYRTDPSGNSGDRFACGVIEFAY